MSTVADFREQRRLDAAAADTRRIERERAADERGARLREQERQDRERDRQERARRRTERAVRRSQSLTPERIYRRGTLALVVASGLASLPAQVAHFWHISPMLLPLPLALEGAAWVIAAGVAYADARRLAAAVRWFLRALVVGAAGFAATINYSYGSNLPDLAPADAVTAGWGLAAVTLFGPLLFEIRQWVLTLSAASVDGAERERAAHGRVRRRHHRKVARLADRLLSAAPYGSLTREQAWARAWQIETGAADPGMTPDLHRRAVASAAALAKAQQPVANAEESTETMRKRSTADLPESTPEPITATVVRVPDPVPVDYAKSAPVLKPLPPVDPASIVAPIERRPVVAESTPTRRRATGRVPDVAKPTRRPKRTPDQLLVEARAVTADWPDAKVTGEGIRREVRTSPANARMLRDTILSERAAAAERAA